MKKLLLCIFYSTSVLCSQQTASPSIKPVLVVASRDPNVSSSTESTPLIGAVRPGILGSLSTRLRGGLGENQFSGCEPCLAICAIAVVAACCCMPTPPPITPH